MPLCKDCGTMMTDVRVTKETKCNFLVIDKTSQCPLCGEVKLLIGIHPFTLDGGLNRGLSYLACSSCATVLNLFQSPVYASNEDRRRWEHV